VAPNDTDLDTLYITCVDGNTTVDGNTDWREGDYIRWVNDSSTWFQNRARGTAVPMDTIAFNWTCDVWVPPTQPAEMNVWKLESPGLFMVHVTGAANPQCEIVNSSCVLTSPILPEDMQIVGAPSQYRIVLTDNNFGTFAIGFGHMLIGKRIRVWNSLKVPATSQDTTGQWPNCIFNSEGGGVLNLRDFYFIYQASPPAP